MQIQVAAMAWFQRDDYESFRPVLRDRAWHATYDDWLAAAEAGFKKLEQQGLRVVKAPVRSADFVRWCTDTGRRVQTQALVDFANEVALRVHMEQQTH